MEPKTVYFTTDPEGIVNFARCRYWFEDAKQHGVNILRCFIGLEPHQITKILEGDATIIDVNGKNKYVEISNEIFKQELKDFIDCRKKYDDANFIYLGGSKVEKVLVDEYAGHVVKRLRETMRNTHYGIMLEPKDINEILGLEHQRQDMHEAILESVGFDRNDNSEEACEFKHALDDYVDKLAGTIRDEPIEEMDPNEIETKRKQSDQLVSYVNKYIG